MSTLIGNINVFDHKNHEWSIFHSRLSQFLKLNKITDDNKSAVLLTHLSDESYRLARDLVHPKDLEKLSYDELTKALGDHFTPKRSTFADRAMFYEAVKQDNESIEDWAARIRGLAVYCEFGSALDTLLRDRFVLGLGAGAVRDRLFEQDSATLTLARALEIAQQAECARRARSSVAGAAAEPRVKEEPVYRVSERRGFQGRRGPAYGGAGDEPRCSVCGLKNHDASKCRFKNYKCVVCGEKGHLKKVCKVQRASVARVNNIDTVPDQDHDDDEHNCKECQLFNLRYVKYEPIKLSILANNINVTMELDSGSGSSVISEDLYLKMFSKCNLQPSDLKMCLYNGHRITPLGYFVCKVTYSNQCHDINFYVIKNGGPGLLGRDFMTKFNICFTVYNNNIISQSQNEVQQLLNAFPDVWKDELGCFNKFEIELHLKDDAEPKFFKPRSIPFALKEKVNTELDRLVSLGILVPVDFSEFATPIVPVLKENGKVKIAGDFSCTLNKVLKIDKYPLPRIEEVFAKIGGGEYYSKLDLSNAYNQFKLKQSSQCLTTINTPKGLFKYTRLVYGLANAPAIFQRTMETLLSGIEGVSCWLDDVCCTGPTAEIHRARLTEVLRRFQDAGLRLQRDKCSFFQPSVTYLGYVIDKNGLRTCPNKVSAIINAPTPTNVTELKRFLGVINYYRNFIPNASALMHPLHRLLREDAQWCWTDREQAALTRVKQELAGERVLAHFDAAAPLVLSVDAGPGGLGAVLAHVGADGRERPVAFASRALSVSERNYSQIQKEATAIIFGVKHFHQYLYGRRDPFILKTDHRPLLSIFGKKNGISVTAALRLQRYAIILSAYNYTVQYVSSKNNLVADFFSRAPLPIGKDNDRQVNGEEDGRYFLFLDSTVQTVSFADIRRATESDRTLKTVVKYMNRGWPKKIKCADVLPYFNCKNDLELHEGCLFRGHRIVIPPEFRNKMLEELHSSHFGVVKTKSSARSRMWWPGIDSAIESWVGACGVCAGLRAAPPRAPPAPWPRAPGPWHRIHIDYMSVGQCVYLIIVDSFSKWLECLHMNCGTSTSALISKLKYIFSRYGIPNVIVSDNDVKICSSEFETFCKCNGITYLTSPVYHPASNGQAENSVKTCKKMIKCILTEKNEPIYKIQEKLAGFLFDYRNTVHCSTGATPAKLMMGRNLRGRLDLILPVIKNKDGSTSDQKHLCKHRSFEINESVMAKWFIARKSIWSPAIIVKKIGQRLFEVYFIKYDVTCKRHLDQIVKNNKRTGNKNNFENQATISDSSLLGPQQEQPLPQIPKDPVNPPVTSSLDTNDTEEVENEVCDDNDEWTEANDEPVDNACADQTANPPLEPSSTNDDVVLDGGEMVGRKAGPMLRPRKNIDFKQFF